jgi:hypothetical protein
VVLVPALVGVMLFAMGTRVLSPPRAAR